MKKAMSMFALAIVISFAGCKKNVEEKQEAAPPPTCPAGYYSNGTRCVKF